MRGAMSVSPMFVCPRIRRADPLIKLRERPLRVEKSMVRVKRASSSVLTT